MKYSLQENLYSAEIPSLNGIRALSVLTVILWHVGFSWAPSSYGVTAFFVLSGFLITHLLIRESEQTGGVSLKRFYLRRSLRVFPAFYAFALVYVIGRLFRGMSLDWPQVITSLTYTRDYYQALVRPVNNSMGHTWSLAVEEQFYLLWPVIFLRFRTRKKLLMKVLLWTILIVWVYRAVLQSAGINPDYIYYAFDTRMDALAVGCLTAVAVHHGFLSWSRSWTFGPILVAGICLLRAADGSRLWHVDFHAVVVNALFPVLCALLIVHAIQFAGHPFYLCLNNPVARYLGVISYSLYLYHPLVKNIFGHSHLSARVAVELASSVVIASASYFFVEKPFLLLKRRLGSQRNTERGIILRACKIFKHFNRISELAGCRAATPQWTRLTGAYLGFPVKYPFSINLKTGPFVFTTLADVRTFWPIFFSGIYDVRAADKLILDVGANIGAFSLFALLKSPLARVIAIEPAPDSCDRLRDAIREHGFEDRCEVHQVALGRVSGTTKIDLRVPSQFRSTDSTKAWATEVSVRTLDEVIGEREVDFLKVDVEGSEYEILANAQRLNQVKRISLEYHPNRHWKDSLLALEQFAKQKGGMNCVASRDDGEGYGIAVFERDRVQSKSAKGSGR